MLGGRFRLNLDKGWFRKPERRCRRIWIGSQQTYQTIVTIGKECKKKYSLLVGYRYFAVDYKNGGFLYNVHMNGPVVGFNLHYK